MSWAAGVRAWTRNTANLLAHGQGGVQSARTRLLTAYASNQDYTIRTETLLYVVSGALLRFEHSYSYWSRILHSFSAIRSVSVEAESECSRERAKGERAREGDRERERKSEQVSKQVHSDIRMDCVLVE